MNTEELRATIRQVIQEELKDLNKKVDRIYEDREDIINTKNRVGTLEDTNRDILDRLKKLEKNVLADIKDVHAEVLITQEAVKEAAKND